MYEKVSIIMPSYNYALYIKQAIESVLNQTYQNWDLIIIDDASTDYSLNIINEYVKKDSRVKLIINEKNLGLASTLKKAIDFADGEWIAFLESDDELLPESVEERLKAVRYDADLVYTDVEPFQDKEKTLEIEKYYNNVNKYLTELDCSKFIEDFPKIIYKSNIIPTFSCVMVKKELIKACRFNPICKTSLDHYLWAQLSDKKIYYINKKLTHWRLHKDSYLNKVRSNWIARFLFSISIYSQTVKNRFWLIRLFLILNYIRTRLFYCKFSRKQFKLSFFNDKILFEKEF